MGSELIINLANFVNSRDIKMLSIRISLVQTILLSIFLFQTLNGMKPDPPKQSAKHSVVEVEKSTPSTKEKITKIMLTKHVIPEFIQRRIPTIEGEFIRSVLKRGRMLSL